MTKIQAEIAVISSRLDAHIPFVQAHLDQPMLIFDPAMLVAGEPLTYEPKAGKTHVTYDGKELTGIKSIWFRKPVLDREIIPLSDKHKDYGLETLTRHIWQFNVSFPEALWVSDYYAIRKANDNIFQLTTAQKLGFKVPETIISSDKDAVRVFADKWGTIIMKTLYPMRDDTEGNMKIFFSTRLHKGKLPNLDTLYTSPAVFQQIIDNPICDIRVTVIKDKVFAASIITTPGASGATVRDWRK
jgi:hypothetical protein